MTTLTASQLVAKNVARVREEREPKLKQAELARMLGWSRNTVHKLENGRRNVTVDDLLSLAMALHVAPAALLVPWYDDETLGVTSYDGNLEAELDGAEAFGWIVGAASPATLLNMLVQFPNYFRLTPSSVQRRFGEELLTRLRERAGWKVADDGSYVTTASGVTVRWSQEKDDQ